MGTGQAAAHKCKDMRTEVRNLDPGQYQEARVVDHQGQVLLAQFGGPPYEVVARCEPPGGGGEAEHGEQPAVSIMDGVAHLRAHQGLVAEVVIAVDGHAQSLAVVHERRQRLGLAGIVRQGGEFEFGLREQDVDRSLQRGLRRVRPRLFPIRAGPLLLQQRRQVARLVPRTGRG